MNRRGDDVMVAVDEVHGQALICGGLRVWASRWRAWETLASRSAVCPEGNFQPRGLGERHLDVDMENFSHARFPDI